MDVTDHPTIDLDEQTLVRTVRRVAQGPQERLAVGTVENVE